MSLLDLGIDAAAAIVLTLQLFLNAGNIGIVVVHVTPQHGHLTVQLLMGGLEHIHFQANSFQFAVLSAKGFAHFFRVAVKTFQIIVSLLQHERSGCIVLFCLLSGSGELLQRVHPDSHFHALQFVLQLQIFLSLFGLNFQRFQLQFQLGNFVTDTEQIVFRVLQFPLSFFLAVAVLGDTRCLFKDLTAVGTLQRKNFIDTTLTDIGVALTT